MKTKSKKSEILVPFDIWGDLLHYPEGWPRVVLAENILDDGRIVLEDYRENKVKVLPWSAEQLGLTLPPEPKECRHTQNAVGTINGVVWVKNYEFSDSLRYMTYFRGRSATYMGFVSLLDQRKYTMFLTDFDDIVEKMVKGVVNGRFTFSKRGKNFGVKLVE